jgi:hypothetical protein
MDSNFKIYTPECECITSNDDKEFNVSADSGPLQTILNNDTLQINGGIGISTNTTSIKQVVLNLENTGVTADTYTNPTIVVDSQGRITSATSSADSEFKLTGDSGPIETIIDGDTLNIQGGTGISTTTNGLKNMVLDLENTGVTADTYTNPTIVVDSQGRITSATSSTIGSTPAYISVFVSTAAATSSASDRNIFSETGQATTTTSLNNVGFTNGVFTVNDTGAYEVTANVIMNISSGTADARNTVYFKKNGTTLPYTQATLEHYDNNVGFQICVNGIFDLTATDTMSVFYKDTNGGASQFIDIGTSVVIKKI